MNFSSVDLMNKYWNIPKSIKAQETNALKDVSIKQCVNHLIFAMVKKRLSAT